MATQEEHDSRRAFIAALNEVREKFAAAEAVYKNSIHFYQPQAQQIVELYSNAVRRDIDTLHTMANVRFDDTEALREAIIGKSEAAGDDVDPTHEDESDIEPEESDG